MKIVKIGSFRYLPEENLMNPFGWIIDVNNIPEGGYVLGLDILGDGIVSVNGVEIVEWSEKYKEVKEQYRKANKND